MIKKTLFFGNPAYLSTSKQQLVIKLTNISSTTPDAEAAQRIATRTVPIEDIGIVVLDSPMITITSGLMQALLDNSCSVITCSANGMPSGLLLPLYGNNIQSERFRSQLESSLPLRKQLWQQTVAQKIANQRTILASTTDVETGCMNEWSKAVRSGDPDNLEGRAAAYYWKNLFPDLPSFKRDREGLPPNNMLNYGYAILRAVIARSLVISGLLPTLGIHHHNRYNAYCLADDIMEPYRPYVDQLVIDLRKELGDVPQLTRDVKSRLLTIPTLDVVVKGKRSPLMVAASQTTASLAKCFEGELRKIDYPEIQSPAI